MPGGSALADKHERQKQASSALAAAKAATAMGKAATSAAYGYTSAVSAPPGGGPTPAYYGSSAALKSSSSSAAAAAKEARQQAARQRRQKQARQVQKKVDKQRKQRSGQDLKLVKSQQRQAKKVTPKIKVKQTKLTGDVKKPKLSPIAEVVKPIIKSTKQRLNTSGNLAGYQVRYGAKQIKDRVDFPTTLKPSVAKPKAQVKKQRTRQGAPTGLTKPLPTNKKPRKVATRLEKAVRKSGPDTSKYSSLGPAAPQMAKAAVKYGRKFGVRPSFLMGIAENETGFGSAAGSGTPGAGAVSTAGAQGYMQFMPESRDTVLKATGHDAFSKNPKEAVAAAAGYFKVFAPDAKNDYERAYSYNHADWYAKDVTSDAKKYRELDKVKATSKEIPTKLKRTARQVLGKKPTKVILKGGKVVRDPDAGGTGPVKVDSAKAEIKAGAIEKTTKKEDKFFSYDHSTDRAWFDPVLKEQLIKLSKASGEPIQLNSGFRTLDEQKAAYADYQAGGALAATPGSSNHEYGLAADISFTDKQRSMLGQFGLGLPVGGEDWHVEVTDPALKAKQTAVNLGTGGSTTVTGGDTNVPIKGTKLAVKKPLPPTTDAAGTATSGTSTFSGSLSPSDATGAPSTGGKSKKVRQAARRRRARRSYVPYADSPGGYYNINPDDYAADPFLKRLAELAQ